MTQTREEFANLILEEINGLISERGRAILQQAVTTRTEIAAYREHLHQRFNVDAFAATNERLDKDASFSKLQATLPLQLSIIPMGRCIAIAASILYFNWRRQLLGVVALTQNSYYHRRYQPEGREVRLQLANGQQIILSHLRT